MAEADTAQLRVRVTPRAHRDQIDSIGPDAFGHMLVRLRVRAVPADGAANQAVIKLLAKSLGMPKSKLTLSAGASARIKTIEVVGLDQDQVLGRLKTAAS